MPENASAWAKVATVTIVVSAYASSAARCVSRSAQPRCGRDRMGRRSGSAT